MIKCAMSRYAILNPTLLVHLKLGFCTRPEFLHAITSSSFCINYINFDLASKENKADIFVVFIYTDAEFWMLYAAFTSEFRFSAYFSASWLPVETNHFDATFSI